jgi:hypothetical protein
MTKYEQLTNALLKAVEAAKRYANTEDGGTCNFDSPAISYRGMKKSLVEKAIEAAGLRSYEWKLFGEKMLVICGGCYGQGNCRTRMAEAMTGSLKASGYAAMTYYQMD